MPSFSGSAALHSVYIQVYTVPEESSASVLLVQLLFTSDCRGFYLKMTRLPNLDGGVF